MNWSTTTTDSILNTDMKFGVLAPTFCIYRFMTIRSEDKGTEVRQSDLFTPQPLRAVGVLFSPMVSGWAGGWASGRPEKVCPASISETVKCRKLILGRDIG